MIVSAIVLALAFFQAHADDEVSYKKSSKVGSIVETIGAGEVLTGEPGESGLARFTFWEKTYPYEEKSIITCGVKTNVSGNYTLQIVRPDQTSETILVIVAKDDEKLQQPSENLKAYFAMGVENIRPSVVHIRLLQGPEDKEGLYLGAVEITKESSVRHKRSSKPGRKNKKDNHHGKKHGDEENHVNDEPQEDDEFANEVEPYQKRKSKKQSRKEKNRKKDKKKHKEEAKVENKEGGRNLNQKFVVKKTKEMMPQQPQATVREIRSIRRVNKPLREGLLAKQAQKVHRARLTPKWLAQSKLNKNPFIVRAEIKK